MPIKISNFFNYQNNNSKIGDFQDLEHVDGVSISATSANLYNLKRDDVVLFYFRKGASYANVYTQSKIISENIKWNQKIKTKKIKCIMINTRNANAFTGTQGYKSLKIISEKLAEGLTLKQKEDEEQPVRIKSNEILFACTGTIGEPFPLEKISSSLPSLLKNLKYTQNKYLWIKASMGILTTDIKPKMSMEECRIGNTNIKIYGIAKGSGMIYPNMATTLGFLFTDAKLSSAILKKILKKGIANSFNAITCDGDTSTNDMVSIFATGEAKNTEIKNINDQKLTEFQKRVDTVLLNLAKSIVADGEGASKFITVSVINCKKDEDAKKIAFSIANSPLVKTAINGEDPNWGRIVMALGKTNIKLNINKLKIFFGNIKIIENGQIYSKYREDEASEYMKNEKIDITVDLNIGNRNFIAYTMDFSKDYININSDYRS